MKKITLVTVLSLCAAGAYAQGLLSFTDELSGNLSQVYSPEPTGNLTTGNAGWVGLAGETVGNTSAQLPKGSQATYTSTPIGGQNDPNGGTPSAAPYSSYQYGNNYSVQIYWYQPTAAVPASHLTAGSTFLTAIYTTLLTTEPSGDGVHGNGNPSPAYAGTMATTAAVGAGYIAPGPQSQAGGLYGETQTQSDATSLSQIDNTAVIALACWYNAGNTITSYAQAEAAGNVPYGISLPAYQGNLGESATDETDFGLGQSNPQQAQGLNITSFSLINPVPEPSTIALGVMGVCAFLARRRIK